MTSDFDIKNTSLVLVDRYHSLSREIPYTAVPYREGLLYAGPTILHVEKSFQTVFSICQIVNLYCSDNVNNSSGVVHFNVRRCGPIQYSGFVIAWYGGKLQLLELMQ